MPDGRFTVKEDRMAKHVAESEEASGKSPKEAEAIGYATANKHKSAFKSLAARAQMMRKAKKEILRLGLAD